MRLACDVETEMNSRLLLQRRRLPGDLDNVPAQPSPSLHLHVMSYSGVAMCLQVLLVTMALLQYNCVAADNTGES